MIPRTHFSRHSSHIEVIKFIQIIFILIPQYLIISPSYMSCSIGGNNLCFLVIFRQRNFQWPLVDSPIGVHHNLGEPTQEKRNTKYRRINQSIEIQSPRLSLGGTLSGEGIVLPVHLDLTAWNPNGPIIFPYCFQRCPIIFQFFSNLFPMIVPSFSHHFPSFSQKIFGWSPLALNKLLSRYWMCQEPAAPAWRLRWGFDGLRLVVFATPLKNTGVSQLGWWHSQLNGKI